MTHCGLEKSRMDCSAGGARTFTFDREPLRLPLGHRRQKDPQNDQGNSKIPKGRDKFQEDDSRRKHHEDEGKG